MMIPIWDHVKHRCCRAFWRARGGRIYLSDPGSIALDGEREGYSHLDATVRLFETEFDAPRFTRTSVSRRNINPPCASPLHDFSPSEGGQCVPLQSVAQSGGLSAKPRHGSRGISDSRRFVFQRFGPHRSLSGCASVPSLNNPTFQLHGP